MGSVGAPLRAHAASSGASAHGTAGHVAGPSSCTHHRSFARTTSGAASFPNVSQSERHAARSSALATSTSHFERSAVATHAARPFKTTRCRPSSAACASPVRSPRGSLRGRARRRGPAPHARQPPPMGSRCTGEPRPARQLGGTRRRWCTGRRAARRGPRPLRRPGTRAKGRMRRVGWAHNATREERVGSAVSGHGRLYVLRGSDALLVGMLETLDLAPEARAALLAAAPHGDDYEPLDVSAEEYAPKGSHQAPFARTLRE